MKPKQVADFIGTFLTHSKNGSVSMNNMKMFQIWSKFSPEELETFRLSIVFAINKKNKDKLEELIKQRDELDRLINSIEKS